MNSPLLHAVEPYLLPVLYGVVIVLLLPLLAGYIVLLERKVMADMQARLGPMRVGPHGLLQPIADAVKLLIKEDIIPEQADRWIFWLAPVLSVTAAMLAYAAIPFGPAFQIADLNIGLLFVVAISSMGIFGIVLGGWASNSHYSLLGALRSSAQLVSYETAAGLALVSALLFGGSLSLRQIVLAQEQGMWLIVYAPIGFFIYLVASIAETNRAPFDMPEAESELVAGYMTEYSGFRWALYFLGEYANMVVVASVATVIFLGGWLRPLASVHAHLPGTGIELLDLVPSLGFLGLAGYCVWRAPRQPVTIQKLVMLLFGGICAGLAGALAVPLAVPKLAWLLPGMHGGFWFVAKVMAYLYAFLWVRFTFPRYRFDQLMRLGWHILIPLALVNVLMLGTAIVFNQAGWNLALALVLANGVTLGVAAWLALLSERRVAAYVAAGGVN